MRRILHYSPGPTDFAAEISDRAIAGAWFELNRLGGCGAGELRLKDGFPDRHAIDIGDWIAFDVSEAERWYLGRVESRQSRSPAGVTFRLEGMGVALNEVFPGGFHPTADGRPPHRYAATDLFFNDPDYPIETFDSVNAADDVVKLLLQQYVTAATPVGYDPANVEPAIAAGEVVSLKFRGEESVRAALKELALRARNASWGVDENGDFFFLQPRTTTLVTWREGRDLLSLEESRERDNLFNRVLLTGDYVYDAPVNSDVTARGFYRWRGNYTDPSSRGQHGERRIRLWVPWIRTRSDSEAFVREFFRVYAQPTSRYLIEVASATLPRPWLGRVRIEDRDGAELITAAVETIRVQFDHTPRFRLQLGPEDPRTLWPEPPHDERWEIAVNEGHGGDSLTDSSSATFTDSSSDESSDASSDLSSSSSESLSSDVSSEMSDLSSDPSSDDSSAASSNEVSSIGFSSSVESFPESSEGPDSSLADDSSDAPFSSSEPAATFSSAMTTDDSFPPPESSESSPESEPSSEELSDSDLSSSL